MTLKKLAEEAERNYNKWHSIVRRGAHERHGKTQPQAVALRNYHEGRLDAFNEAKLLK